MKMASGRRFESAKTPGAAPWWTVTLPDRAATFLAIRSARTASRSKISARPPCRAHSMPIDPVPPPTSHSSAPGRGSNAATVIWRIGAFVSWPSESKSPSRSQPRALPDGSTASTVRLPAGTGGFATVPSATASGSPVASVPPRLVSAVSLVSGRSAKTVATSVTESAFRHSTRKGRSESATGTTRAAPGSPGFPVTSEITGVSCKGQPR